MATTSTPLASRAWNARELHRQGRAIADLAVAELTQTSRSPVRDPDFHARTRRLLAVPPANPAAALRQLAAASLRLNHPCFMAQQIAAPIPLAALAESFVAALNQSIAVWDMSPAGTLVDREVIARFKSLLGFPASAEGSLTPGGSYANLTALLAARAALDPQAWSRGSQSGNRIAILAGAHTHYSIARAAGIMGLGTGSVFPVATDAEFRTDPAALPAAAAAARRAGFRRFIVVATSGSTPTGSFDNLAALAAATRRLRTPACPAWFHVDAAHGGGMAFSPQLRPLLRGLTQADSVAFDPHKMMFMPLTAGAVLVRRGDHLRQAFEQNAPYLFTPVAKEVSDVGPFTVACSQRFDALKIWLVWQTYGSGLFAELAESVCRTTQAAFDECQRSPRLEPLHRPHSNILCFRLAAAPRNPAGDQLHWQVKEAVNGAGRAYISSTVLAGRRCLRLVVMNPRSEPRHAIRVLREVVRIARSV